MTCSEGMRTRVLLNLSYRLTNLFDASYLSIAKYKHKKIADIAAIHSNPGPVMGQELKLNRHPKPYVTGQELKV